MVAHRAKLSKIPVVFVNLVGGNDGIIFDGASLVATHPRGLGQRAGNEGSHIKNGGNHDCNCSDSMDDA